VGRAEDRQAVGQPVIKLADDSHKGLSQPVNLAGAEALPPALLDEAGQRQPHLARPQPGGGGAQDGVRARAALVDLPGADGVGATDGLDRLDRSAGADAWDARGPALAVSRPAERSRPRLAAVSSRPGMVRHPVRASRSSCIRFAGATSPAATSAASASSAAGTP
jgi:hypothetical protein